MRLLPGYVAVALATTLTACGEGGIPQVAEPSRVPLQTFLSAHRAPVVHSDGNSHIGADVAAPVGRLRTVAAHGDVSVSHGTIDDGIEAAELIAYLRADALSYRSPDAETGDGDVQLIPDGLVFRFAETPPTVRVVEGTPLESIDETVRVVQAINAALPREWQLRFDPEPLPGNTQAPEDGEISVAFAPQADWPSEAVPPIAEDIGLAQPRYGIVPTGDPADPFRIAIVSGRVWVDPTQTGGLERLGVIAHELIHLLGRGHVDPARFPETLMVAGGSEEVTPHILHPLDREALLAVYGRLVSTSPPDGLADALGPWSSTSFHVRGDLEIGSEEIAFGAAARNGLSQPWAVGATPNSYLADNAALSGEVRWSGRLLGLTPNAETVAGAARLTVRLPAMSGSLNFSGLERWATGAAPGPAGSGTVWNDGELSYRIAVHGNAFAQTGGDTGHVTGTFYGSAHEGMGGVLVRDDLSAGFGGKR